MSKILIEKVRIKNFRALREVEVSLEELSLLVGANNAGKTTFLRALNAVLGASRSVLNKDDLFIDQAGHRAENQIIIDIKIIPADEQGQRVAQFSEQWTGVFDGESIATENDQEYFAFRSTYNFLGDDMPEAAYTLITNWSNEQLGVLGEFRRVQQVRNNIRMYYIDAQRDIEEDLRLRTSYFGKMAARISDDYNMDDIAELTILISSINEAAVEKSPVLKYLKDTLAKLNQTTQTRGSGVDISPFSRNVRDLHKGMKVDFQDQGSDRFSMEYHGMGTRSWASILTAGAYIGWELQQIERKIEAAEDTTLLFPIIAVEEPEAHLHPNAQRTLYRQMKDFKGQKIISTHSPYIAGQAELEELRHFYKERDVAKITQLYFRVEEDKKITQLYEVIRKNNDNGEHINKQQLNIEIEELKNKAKGKLSSEDVRKIRKEIFENRGELLFSKAIVLFEGETELASLPIFAKAYFQIHPYMLGITFADVGGKKNYSPFLQLAKFLDIPVFILSDADGNTEEDVNAQVMQVFDNMESISVHFLETGSDFEKSIWDCCYDCLINEAIDTVEGKQKYIEDYIKELNGKPRKGGGTRDYNNQEGERRALLDCMRDNKIKYAAAIAEQFVSFHVFPPKVEELFHEIKEKLQLSIHIDQS